MVLVLRVPSGHYEGLRDLGSRVFEAWGGGVGREREEGGGGRGREGEGAGEGREGEEERGRGLESRGSARLQQCNLEHFGLRF